MISEFYQNLENSLRDLSVESISIHVLEDRIVAHAFLIDSRGIPMGSVTKKGDTLMEAVEGVFYVLSRKEGEI